MTSNLLALFAPLYAQVSTRTNDPVTYVDWPEEAFDWTILGGLIALAVVTVVVYLQDARGVGSFWKAWLPLLRLCVILGLIVVFLNPHRRSSEEAIAPSRIVLLIDTSASMDLKNELPEAGSDDGGILSRSEAVRELIEQSGLVGDLRKHHEVVVYTFNERLSKPIATFSRLGPKSDGDGEGDDVASAADEDAIDPAEELVAVDWEEFLKPGGAETRLGDAVRDLVREYASDTFAGIVVFSDGANNAGNDPDFAKGLARKQNVRLVTVGLGSTSRLANVRITGVQMPSRAHIDDPYTITAYVRGDNVEGRRVRVELLGRPKDDPNAPYEVVAVDPGSRNPVDVDLVEDGVEEEVVFERTSTVAGEYEFKLVVTPTVAMPELDEADNEHVQDLTVSKEPIKVLIIAGGPMREYHFVRDMMARHKGIETSLWLQTVEPQDVSLISQDANNPLLTSFPEKAELFADFDVIIAFDPDWSRLTPEQRSLLEEWVGRESGGMIIVAGDVSTEELVTADESYQDILDLYPVALEAAGLNVQLDLGDGSEVEAWAPDFTEAGRNVEFLQVGADPSESFDAWQEFEGFYRCYPTLGKKAGAVVYAYFSNPKAMTAGQPHILVAGHYYEGGRVLYLGSPEMWRMRAVGQEEYERFWTKTLREVAQGRLNRTGNGSTIAPERERYFLGQTVVVRARVLDANFDAVEQESIELDVVDPNGKPLLPRPRLRPEPGQPGVYKADFRAGVASTKSGYEITMKIPGTEDVRKTEVKVTVPNLEYDQPEQNAALLRDLAKGGDREYYVTVEDAAERVPTFLVDRTKPIIVDERRNELWDKAWVMYLLVALLSMEWLSRKLLKMA